MITPDKIRITRKAHGPRTIMSATLKVHASAEVNTDDLLIIGAVNEVSTELRKAVYCVLYGEIQMCVKRALKELQPENLTHSAVKQWLDAAYIFTAGGPVKKDIINNSRPSGS